MVDLITFRSDVTLIVTHLARSVLTETLTAAEDKLNPETEEELSALVDSLCVEAVDKILKMLLLAAVKQDDTPTHLKDPPESEESGDGLMKPTEGEDGAGERPPAEQTYILVYGNSAVDSKCLLGSPQSDANANANGDRGREVCLQDFSDKKPTAFLHQPIESNQASANDVPFSLSPQILLQTNHPELDSPKLVRGLKRKRTSGPDSQANPFDSEDQTPSTSSQQPPSPKPAPLTALLQSVQARLSLDLFPSTSNASTSHSSASAQHTTTAPPPKVFKEIYSILPLSSGGKKKRCKITVEELARRVGPPENMSFSSLAAYLRTDNNARKELQVQLEEAGIKPTQLTSEVSLFSRLCEEEVDSLCVSLAGLVRDHLPFRGLHVVPDAEDELVTLGKLVEFWSQLRRAMSAIKDRVETVDLASHGFMSKMLDIILSIFEKCVINQMRSENGTEATGETTSLHSERSSSSPPLQADFFDHEYARPSSPPPGAASAVEGGVSAGSSRKQHRRRRKKGSSTSGPAETTESLRRCSQCGMLFPNTERLSDHEKKSHPVCSVCGVSFTGVLRLREHEIKEHGLLPYSCDYCPKRFNRKIHRDLHVKARHTGEKTCHCDVCGKGYSCVSVLKKHLMTHFDKTFVCDVCGKSFYRACHLTRHKQVHEEVRPHRCATCGKSFKQAGNLRSHQTIHSGERQLCSVCGKSYRCLKNHVISKHSHELPAAELPANDSIITCQVCGKKFPYLSQFKLHERSHTGEKPFHCDVCGKSYRLKEQLRDHRYTHTGEKPYRCSLCSKTFNLATSFMRHRSIHSGETPYSCSACGKHFRLLTFLKAHLQTKAHLKQTQQRRPALPSDL